MLILQNVKLDATPTHEDPVDRDQYFFYMYIYKFMMHITPRNITAEENQDLFSFADDSGYKQQVSRSITLKGRKANEQEKIPTTVKLVKAKSETTQICPNHSCCKVQRHPSH